MMRTPPTFAVCMTLVAALSACDQWSQDLPFEPDPLLVTQQSLGPAGGLVSHPLGLSLEFPRGALERATKITIVVPLDRNGFPGSPEGRLLKETYFSVLPVELELLKPISVDVSVSAGDLEAEDQVRLGFATPSSGAAIRTDGVSFDLTSGILRGEVTSLGAMAAVVADNVIAVRPEAPPTLEGGTFADAASGVAPPVGNAARADSIGRAYSADGPFLVRCSHQGFVRRCFDSGTMDMWSSSEIQDRLGAQMVVLNPDVTGDLEFTNFVDGVPTRAYGSLTVTGTLRVQLGQAVTSFSVDDTFVTNGSSGGTDVTADGNSMTLHSTSTGTRTIEFAVRPSGTGEQLVVRGSKTVEFENEDGSTESATLFIDLRLRR
jgi:hypothetical protein